MLAKLRNHINDIAKSGKAVCYQTEGETLVASAARVIHVGESVPDLAVETMTEQTRDFLLDLMNPSKHEYQLFEDLPSAKELKEGITKLVGRRRTFVDWECPDFAVNARWLLAAMASLNATVCYRPVGENVLYRPILIYKDDDVQSADFEGVMQVRKKNKIGLWEDMDA